jgi:hypothetical protein
MSARPLRLFTAPVALCLSVAAAAQLPIGEGYAEQRWADLPLFGASDFDLVASGEAVLVDRGELVRYDRNGQRNGLWRLPATASLAFIRTIPNARSLLFGDSVSGEIRRLDLPATTPSVIANARYCFDLDFDPRGRAFLVANLDFGLPGARTKILHLDLPSGNLREIANFAGPSGPLQFATDGALFYATQSPIHPTPPGAVQVLRFTGAQVDAALTGTKLTERDGQVWVRNLDGAYRLAFDGRGQLLISDPLNGGLLRVSADGQRQESFVPRDGRHFATALRSTRTGRGVLEPFQPAGEALLLLATDWQGWTRLLELSPVRPELFHVPGNPVPDGALRLFLDRGPRSGIGLLLLSHRLLLDEAMVSIQGDLPLWYGLDPSGLFVTLALPLDPNGGFLLPLTNGADVSGLLGAQVLVLDTALQLRGSSQPDPIELR